MAEMVFIQFLGEDNKTVEASGTRYLDGEKLPDGTWSVLKANSVSSVVMEQDEMPEHWKQQLKTWKQWADSHFD